MSDLIRREDVIEAIYKLPVKVDNFGYTWMIANDVLNQIDDIPSAEPERKKGEWLPHPHEREWDVCSVCGIGCKRREFEMQFGQEIFTEYSYQYCPNCGADMKGKE